MMMKNFLILAGISASVFLFFVLTWGIVAQIANRKPAMQVVDFDFQGLRLGDPFPARLTVKNPKDDLVSELNQGTKSNVWYSILDGKIEGFEISFDSPYQAIDAYEQKFGVKGTYRNDDVVWMTKDGEFVLSKKYSKARISSKKYSEHAIDSVKKKTNEFSKKL
jgi:hypothetical protein